MRQLMSAVSTLRVRTPATQGLPVMRATTRGVAGHAAAGGEDAGRGLHALDVGGAGFGDDENAVAAAGAEGAPHPRG